MKFFRQLKEAILERVAGDKAGSIQGQLWYDTAIEKAKLNNGTSVEIIVSTDNINVTPVGDQGTDGSWRVIIAGTELQFERRELGVWVKKGAFE